MRIFAAVILAASCVLLATGRAAVAGTASVAASHAANLSGEAAPRVPEPGINAYRRPASWDATSSFAASPTVNPAPDQYGHAGVWSWMQGTFDTPGSYQLLSFEPHSVLAQCFSDPDSIFGWSNGTINPFIRYNAGPELPSGSIPCAPADTWPAHSIVAAPVCHCYGGSEPAVIIGWKAPVSGMVTVTGSIQAVNPYLGGLTYEVDFGTKTLAGPTDISTDALTRIGPLHVTVTAGQSIYLEVAPGPDSDGAYDDFVPTFGITRSSHRCWLPARTASRPA